MVHLAARDTTLGAVSRAPPSRLLAYRERMGSSFPRVSSLGTTFNHDFGVSHGDAHNYAPVGQPTVEVPGQSVFIHRAGSVFLTHSCSAHGLDAFNPEYANLDVTP